MKVPSFRRGAVLASVLGLLLPAAVHTDTALAKADKTREAGASDWFDPESRSGEPLLMLVSLADQTIAQLEKIIAGLRAVPVDVQINVLPVEEGADDDLPVAVKSDVKQGE